METLEEKIARVVQEEVAVVPYDPIWPKMFEKEREHLLSCLPNNLVNRIEHFGSTAVPGLSAKPIVDILVEVTSLDQTREICASILAAQGYDYFWRPTWGDDTPPFYAGSSNVIKAGTERITYIWLRQTSSTGIDSCFVTILLNIQISL